MPSRPIRDFLFDIRDNVLRAEQWTASHTRETFRADVKTFYATTRCLEIISEASRGLPQEFRDRHPQHPWRAIQDAGNVYRHVYDNVSEDLVWQTVCEDLPSLRATVESEIASLPEMLTAGSMFQQITASSVPPAEKRQTESSPDFTPDLDP